ncbi:MAG: hypothetical protein M0C28_24445 [Candidatus Moduliflexus flocculans]|nr:hypothetical protein [Candidatus Moduliflexus flocculans]
MLAELGAAARARTRSPSARCWLGARTAPLDEPYARRHRRASRACSGTDSSQARPVVRHRRRAQVGPAHRAPHRRRSPCSIGVIYGIISGVLSAASIDARHAARLRDHRATCPLLPILIVLSRGLQAEHLVHHGRHDRLLLGRAREDRPLDGAPDQGRDLHRGRAGPRARGTGASSSSHMVPHPRPLLLRVAWPCPCPARSSTRPR